MTEPKKDMDDTYAYTLTPVCPGVSPKVWKEIKAKYPHFPDIQDVSAKRREAFLRLPSFVEWWLAYKVRIVKDPRDVIMISLIVNIFCTVAPLQYLLWVYPSHSLGLFYFGFTYYMWAQRWIILLHFAEHRKVFTHSICQWLLNIVCAFFGTPPGSYRLHHIVMHHTENNKAEEDLSSTEPYQRDNIFHFAVYLARHILANLVELPQYAIQNQRYDLAAAFLTGTILSFVLVGIGCMYNPVFILWVLLLPFFTTSTVQMFANFSQHMFLHPDIRHMKSLSGFEYNCKIAFQSINHTDNVYMFNDGYHITHHLNSRLHWSRLPEHFLINLDRYAENGSLVFDGLGYCDVGWYVMWGRFDVLADHLVQFTSKKQPKEEIIQDLKLRLRPIVRPNNSSNLNNNNKAAVQEKPKPTKDAFYWAAVFGGALVTSSVIALVCSTAMLS